MAVSTQAAAAAEPRRRLLWDQPARRPTLAASRHLLHGSTELDPISRHQAAAELAQQVLAALTAQLYPPNVLLGSGSGIYLAATAQSPLNISGRALEAGPAASAAEPSDASSVARTSAYVKLPEGLQLPAQCSPGSTSCTEPTALFQLTVYADPSLVQDVLANDLVAPAAAAKSSIVTAAVNISIANYAIDEATPFSCSKGAASCSAQLVLPLGSDDPPHDGLACVQLLPLPNGGNLASYQKLYPATVTSLAGQSYASCSLPHLGLFALVAYMRPPPPSPPPPAFAQASASSNNLNSLPAYGQSSTSGPGYAAAKQHDGGYSAGLAAHPSGLHSASASALASAAGAGSSSAHHTATAADPGEGRFTAEHQAGQYGGLQTGQHTEHQAGHYGGQQTGHHTNGHHAAKPEELRSAHSTGPEELHSAHGTVPEELHSAHGTGPEELRSAHSTGPEELRSAHSTGPEELRSEHSTGPEELRSAHDTGAGSYGGGHPGGGYHGTYTAGGYTWRSSSTDSANKPLSATFTLDPSLRSITGSLSHPTKAGVHDCADIFTPATAAKLGSPSSCTVVGSSSGASELRVSLGLDASIAPGELLELSPTGQLVGNTQLQERYSGSFTLLGCGQGCLEPLLSISAPLSLAPSCYQPAAPRDLVLDARRSMDASGRQLAHVAWAVDAPGGSLPALAAAVEAANRKPSTM